MLLFLISLERLKACVGAGLLLCSQLVSAPRPVPEQSETGLPHQPLSGAQSGAGG